MAESNREFGDLLTQGLKSIVARENKPILTLEDLWGAELDVTRFDIEKWRQGSVLPDAEKVYFLARACVRNPHTRTLSSRGASRNDDQAQFSRRHMKSLSDASES